MKHILLLFALMLVAMCSMDTFAQVVASPTPIPALSFFDKILAFLPDSVPAWALVVTAFIIEGVMRIWPTAKPKSLLLIVSSILNVLAQIFTKLSKLCDSVLQNTKG